MSHFQFVTDNVKAEMKAMLLKPWIVSHWMWLKNRYETWDTNLNQSSETMLENKLCNVEKRILRMRPRKLVSNCAMNIRRLVSRICLLQSLITIWLSPKGIKNACMLENENDSYFQDQKLQRQMAEMYRLVHGVYRHKISKAVAESVLVKQT